MARLIGEQAWEETPLGPIGTWPEALIQALTTILHSAFQLAIYWGPELVLLYNDAEREPLGDHHPGALGKPARIALAEIWDEIGPMLEGVLATGQATWSEDAPLTLRRAGSEDEGYFTWSYSPIFGAGGRPEGVLLVTTETTRRVLSERRLRSLHALAEQTAQRRSLDEVWERSVEALVGDPDILVAEIQLVAGDTATCVASASRFGKPRRIVGLSGRAGAEAARAGETVVRAVQLDDVDREDCSAVVVPIRISSTAPAEHVLVLCINPLRPVGRSERDYGRLLASHIAAAAADAAALAEERIRFGNAVASAERKRIERDLHDSIQRQLVGARLVTEVTRELATSDPGGVDRMLGELSDQLASASAELREIVAGHYPSLLATDGLVRAVRASVERAHLAVAVDGEVGRLEESIELELYYAVVEAIQNAFKHGGPDSRVAVRFRERRGSVVALVCDSGVGFDQENVSARAGLRNMRQRLESIGGTCRVRSSAGHGTCVRCKCPSATSETTATGNSADEISDTTTEPSTAA